jgi:hypothetical protein
MAEPPPIARIWATVDAERTIRDAGLVAVPLAEDPLLGASVHLIEPPGEVPIAILEPTTEGGIAAALARHGEGPAGTYVAWNQSLDDVGEPLTRSDTGPFGAAAIAAAFPAWGPFMVLVERPAGTIDR